MFIEAKFPLGNIVATPGALEAIDESDQTTTEFLARHAQGDWGDLDAEDKRANQYALENGLRILSAYHTSEGEKLYIITEWNRSVTTILLPEDY